jgi:UDP-2,3-diacylglucosamine pyrophosphatase LpxH
MQTFSSSRKSSDRIFAAQQRFTFGKSAEDSLAPRRYRTAWISDAHLGTRGCNAAALLDFLRENDFDTLYVVGDLIDIWSLRRGIYWPQQHNDVIQKILRKARKGTHVIYIPGNHDELVTDFCGVYGNIEIKQRAIHVTASGERILIIHGHELDAVVQNVKWLAFAGDLGYQFLLSLNPLINFVRRRFGLGYWSLSAYAKRRVKDAVSFIGKFEAAVAHYADRYDVDAVLCGHIHSAAIREFGKVTYYNCGDWVESCTALVEGADGIIAMVNYLPSTLRAATRPQPSELIGSGVSSARSSASEGATCGRPSPSLSI